MVLFRTDGNSIIGSGHIMRCFSIAAVISKCDEVFFVTSDGSVNTLLNEYKVQQIELHTNFKDMQLELPALEKIIHDKRPTFLIVDSYYVTDLYLTSLKKICGEYSCKLVYIDDLVRFAYSCDFLVNYNIYAPGKVGEYKRLYEEAGVREPVMLLGSSYAPLRREFLSLPVRAVKSKTDNIFVSTGGADIEHVAIQIVRRAIEVKCSLQFHIILGSMNKDADSIARLVKEAGSDNIHLYFGVKSMAELMQSCDVAVSAAGSTLYELCAVGIPTITYVMADNQLLGAAGFESAGIMRYVGDIRNNKDFIKRLFDEIRLLAGDYDLRKSMAKEMQSIVDGKGAKRLIDSLK